MPDISFYPGPSKIYPQVAKYMQDACRSGILSVNHRSETFIEISRSALQLLKEKLHIPEDYTVLYTSSATECWEIIQQSLVQRKSFHIFNGAFGERSYTYSKKLAQNPNYALPFPFSVENRLDLSKLTVPNDNEVIFICQNETSNGTALDGELIADLRRKYPEQLIAVDVTSSLAGIFLDFSTADIWYASVQKCFGLPAGMALMILSPKAIEKARTIQENKHYNSLVELLNRIAEYQTNYTPSVLHIYLLMRVMQWVKDIQNIHQQCVERAQMYYQNLVGLQKIRPLIQNSAVRSQTVISVTAESIQIIEEIKEKALKEGILLGNGYGKWKDNTFRIANFPALEDKEIKKLIRFLQKNG